MYRVILNYSTFLLSSAGVGANLVIKLTWVENAFFASCEFNENDTYSSATSLRFLMMHTCCNKGQFYYIGKSCTGLASLSDSAVI